MANSNTPFGLALARSQDASYSGVVTHYYVPASNTGLYIGDAVVKTGTSNTENFRDYEAGTLPAVAKATTGAITGVVVGFEPDGICASAGALKGEGVALVIDNPMAKYNILANGTVTADMVGLNADIAAGTGDDYTGISGDVLDVSSAATTDTLGLKILGVADYVANELGEYSVVEVIINNSTEAHNTSGI